MSDFQTVCSISDLIKNSGVAALVNGKQIALFYIADDVYALSNFDPIGEANVMSRGMIGDVKGELMVAAPLQKQRYNLKTGKNIDDESAPSLPVYEVKVENEQVQVKV